MRKPLLERCCESCWHSAERACPDLAVCAARGPLCHASRSCASKRGVRAARARRERLERPVVYVGTGTCGLGAGAGKTLAAVRAYLAERTVDASIVEVGCIGACSAEPLLEVQLPGRTRVCFEGVTAAKVAGLLERAFAGTLPAGGILGQHRNKRLTAWEGVRFLDEHPFFAPQTRHVLRNCGVIDPGSIDEYIAHGGYAALGRAVGSMAPSEVCRMVEQSGLRGRGSGGLPTGSTWTSAHSQPAEQKYLICNANDGDPGAFMDRAVIEGDPHALLEGMAIAAYAIGASTAYICIRADYSLAIRRLRQAISQAEATGFLGQGILGTSFSLTMIITQGARAFVCGEETALISSIEGRRGTPRPRPPHPAHAGLFGKPTVINSVETLVNAPWIVKAGAEVFAALGTAGSKGTKVLALSGTIARPGLVEVAMGTTLREIVFDIGGGIPDGHSCKAVQIGGPSGGFVPEQHLDIEIGCESLEAAGTWIGSGGLVVMDDRTCMVDVARFFMDFFRRESCGKCIPCREGTRHMFEILRDVTSSRQNGKGDGAPQQLRSVLSFDSLADVIKDTSLCDLGKTAPNPVLSTLRWFRDEYEAHICDRHCPAGVCAELLIYSVNVQACTGCGLCVKACAADAVVGALASPHYIVAERCNGCGSCVSVCKPKAIVVH
jgi:NADH:ubiquinone oxidoreductase subunit F (NADH-binding)